MRIQSRKLKELMDKRFRDGREQAQMSAQVDRIHQSAHNYTEKLIQSGTKINFLDCEIQKKRSELKKKKFQPHLPRVSLENRLEVALVKRNEGSALNVRLCGQLDRFRRERIVLDEIYSKSERDRMENFHQLEGRKLELSRAMQTKDRLEEQMRSLQMRVDAEETRFEQELDRLSEVKHISPDKALPGKAVFPNSDVEKMANALEMWREFIWKARLDKMELLLRKMTEKEDENFKRFQRIEEFQLEQMRLHRQCEAMERVLHASKAEKRDGNDPERAIAQINAQIRMEIDKQHDLDTEYEHLNGELARKKTCIHSIYALVSGNVSSEDGQFAPLRLAKTIEITDVNVLEYLQVVEVLISAMKKRSQADRSACVIPLGHRVDHLSSSKIIQMEIPDFDEAQSFSDEERVYTHKELRQMREQNDPLSLRTEINGRTHHK
uniref:AlNc14C62G4485 protein n=1 Tax=Albugo laibachii Nc14 TaxID=890382 RepID=F0WCV7_9STRA|nr:AlNc14C62G4485 [Albugo laibachii Nc14]|eukprot:CCA19028.1 AlNc14C62G4485 [Albugo laibachii Nc14]